MEVLLFLFLLFQDPGPSAQNKIEADANPEIEVLRFSWAHYRGGLLVSDRRERGNAAGRQRVFRQEMNNRNSIENRSRDMKELEDSVYGGALDSQPDTYVYSVELRNRGAKVVKWIFWDYQTSEPSDPDNISHRQFACAIKIKTDDSESLKAFSSLPPRMIINVNTNMKTPTEKIIINRVEYVDGTIWQRPDWHLPDPFTSRSNGRGKCRPI